MPNWREPIGLRNGRHIAMKDIIEIQGRIKSAKGDAKVDAQTEMLVLIAEAHNAACDDRRVIAIELGIIFVWLAALTTAVGYLTQLHMGG